MLNNELQKRRQAQQLLAKELQDEEVRDFETIRRLLLEGANERSMAETGRPYLPYLESRKAA